MTIGKHIVSKIGSITDLTGKVFPLLAPQGATFPYVVYRRTNTSVEYTNDGSAVDTSAVTLLVIGKDYATTSGYAEEIRAALENVPATYDGMQVEDCEIKDISDEYIIEQDCFAISINVELVHWATPVSPAPDPEEPEEEEEPEETEENEN